MITVKNTKKYIVLIFLVLLVLGAFYIALKLHIEFRDRRNSGYNSPCDCSNIKTFTAGSWKGILLDDDIKYTDGAHNIVPYDFDGDGQVELIANSYRSDSLMIYTYKTDSHKKVNWARHVIDSSVGGGIPKTPLWQYIKSSISVKLLDGFLGGAHYTAVADLNGDGRTDLIVAGDRKKYDVVFYEAPENITDISAWKKHVLYKNDAHKTYHLEVGDIDKDGDLDVVLATKQDKRIGWLENKGEPMDWPVTWIDVNVPFAFNIRVSDLDRDGRNEVIASQDTPSIGGKLHLYSYSGDPKVKQNWRHNRIADLPNMQGLNVFEIADIDNDSNLDIVTGNQHGGIFLLKNPHPANINKIWESFIIAGDWDSREIDVGDIDSDGDQDILIADQKHNRLVWFENNGKNFCSKWSMNIIDESDLYLNWVHHVELADIDRDNILDIAVAAAGSNTFLCYFQNRPQSF
jgi:hypothetical protein